MIFRIHGHIKKSEKFKLVLIGFLVVVTLLIILSNSQHKSKEEQLIDALSEDYDEVSNILIFENQNVLGSEVIGFSYKENNLTKTGMAEFKTQNDDMVLEQIYLSKQMTSRVEDVHHIDIIITDDHHHQLDLFVVLSQNIELNLIEIITDGDYSQKKELIETPSMTLFELKPMNREIEYLYYDEEDNQLRTN